MVDEDRRNFLKKIGVLGGVTAGGTGAFYGFFSLLHGASALSKLNYWQNEPMKFAYEPAIEHAVETGEMDIKTVHLDYNSYSSSEELVGEEYEEGLEEIMEELPQVKNVETSYESLNPVEEEWLPDTFEEFPDYKVGDMKPGLNSILKAAEDEVREEDYQIVNMITSSAKIFEAGSVNPNVDGLAYIQDAGDTTRKIETSAHEDAHLLGIGHTLADGMTNVPAGQAYSAHTEEFFGPKTRSWWEKIMQQYE